MEKKERLMSLDALRGADMLCIMGGAAAVTALCQYLGFGKDCWLATQMTHVAWHGFHQHDTIFPLFLFLAGVAWPFSLAGQRARGRTTRQIVVKILARAVVLTGLGLFGSALFGFDFAHLRWHSVLAHIGCCWAAAALIHLAVPRAGVRAALAGALLVGHGILLSCCTAPDAAQLLASTDPAVAKKVAAYAAWGTGPFSFTGNIVGWLDRTLMPGVLYETVFDPEGLLGTMTGTVTALLGIFAGEWLRRRDWSGNRKTWCLLGAGALALALCFAFKPWIPVNKKLWTATFVLAAAAYSFFLLALFYWIIDVKGCRRWTFFFRVIGMNSIAIYMLMRFVPFRSIGNYFLCGVASLGGDPNWAALVGALGQIGVAWLVLWFLYRTNTFLRV